MIDHKQRHHHKARKRFGQNFLHDQGVIDAIIAAIRPEKTDHLVEIGPGQGALTHPLVQMTEHLDVIELDRDLVLRLKDQFAECNRIHIHQGDALFFDFEQIKEKDQPLRLIGNLPYNISTPLIFHLLTFAPIIRDMHFMLQKEVAERLVAGAGEKNYGRLSVMTGYYCSAEIVLHVGPESFDPKPKVDSAVVRLVPHACPPFVCSDPLLLEKVVRAAFSTRRKTLKNSLKGLVLPETLESLGIAPELRAENLSLKMFVNIANYLHDHQAEIPSA